jgi:hypothetical protein
VKNGHFVKNEVKDITLQVQDLCDAMKTQQAKTDQIMAMMQAMA